MHLFVRIDWTIEVLQLYPNTQLFLQNGLWVKLRPTVPEEDSVPTFIDAQNSNTNDTRLSQKSGTHI